MNALATDLGRVAAREWLREQGLSETISVLDFALHCLRDEGVDADARLAESVLWNCTGFPSFWHVGRDGTHPIECCATQLRGWARVAVRSPERASRVMNDPTYSARQALAEIDAENAATADRILEDD